jgi:hypothetical protein
MPLQMVTGGKPIAVCLQSISGGDEVNPLVAFYDIHVRKREVLILLFFSGHHTKHIYKYTYRRKVLFNRL